MYLSLEQKQATLRNAEEDLRKERIKQTRMQASMNSRSQCAQYRQELSYQRQEEERQQKLKMQQEINEQIRLLEAQREEALRMTGEAHRMAKIQKEKEEEEQRAKMERIAQFNRTAGERSKTAACRFKKEEEESTRGERVLRERQVLVRQDQDRIAHEVAEKKRAYEAYLERTRPPPPPESEIHAFKNSRENQIRKIEEFKNTTFHNTQIVRHEPTQGEKNAAERAVEEAEKARQREMNKENTNLRNRLRAGEKGGKAMGLEKVSQEYDEMMKELEKLQKAEGMLRVKEKPKSRAQMERETVQKEKAIEKKFEQEFGLEGIEEEAVVREERKEKRGEVKLRVKRKSKERKQSKTREEKRRIPPHSLEARYEEPKVTLSIKEQGGESEGVSEPMSESSARLQQSVSIKVPSVQGTGQAQELEEYPTPMSVKTETARKQKEEDTLEESKQEGVEEEEESPQDIRNKMEGTLSNRFRREIVPPTHGIPQAEVEETHYDSGMMRQPIMTPAFQGEGSIRPWDVAQMQHQIYPPAPAIQYSPLRDRVSDDSARVKRTEIVESGRIGSGTGISGVPSPPSLINTQQIKDFVEQNREYLPQNVSKSPESLSSLPYSSSMGTSSKYYSSLNNSRPRVHNYTIKEEDSKFSDTSLQQSKHDASPLQTATREVPENSSVTTSQLIENMSLSKLCPADTDEPREDTSRSVPKPKRISALSQSLSSITGVKPARYIPQKAPVSRDTAGRQSDDLLNQFLAQRQSTERLEKEEEDYPKVSSGRSEQQIPSNRQKPQQPFEKSETPYIREERGLSAPLRPPIMELDKKISPTSEEERRIMPLSRAELEKYMYANVEESKELSTPGRITNPDNLSESSAAMGDMSQNSFTGKQISQNLEEGVEAGVKGSRGLESDVEFNYSFSELGQGRSTIKKQEENVEGKSGVAKEILEFKKITEEYKQKVEEGAGKAWRGDIGDSAQNAPTLADVFRKRKQQMVGKIEKRKEQQQEEFQKRREQTAEQGARSKEDILKQRKEMMRSKVKGEKEESQAPLSPHSQLMHRLAHGQKVQLSKGEMHQLSKKNYEQLPEIKQKREAQLKKEKQRERMEKAKEFERKRKEVLKKKAN